MGLFSLVVYGVGDMVGSGIYGTVGKAAGALGNAVWLAFVVSMVAAILTGLSYASLASRYPRAAGAAFVTNHAYGLPYLSYLIGLFVTASGLTSMATSTNVFANTLQSLVGGPWIVLVLGVPRLHDGGELLGPQAVDVDQPRLHGGRGGRAVVHRGDRRSLLGHDRLLRNARRHASTPRARSSTTASASRCCSPARCSRSSRSSASKTCSTSPRK